MFKASLLLFLTAIKEVDEQAEACESAVKFVTDVQGMEKKLKSTAEYLKTCHDMSKDPQKNFTWTEVAKYDGEDGRRIYIVIDNIVYDITEMAKYHPGGEAALKKHAGQDATSAVKVMSVDIFEPFLHLLQVGYIEKSEQDHSSAPEYIMKNAIDNRL